MKSSKAAKAKKQIKKLREKGASVVKLTVKKDDGEKEKYIVKKLDIKITTTEHKGEIRFQSYKAGKTKGSFVPSDHVKFSVDKVKKLKVKKTKAKKAKVKTTKKPVKKATAVKAQKKTAKK